MQQRATGALLQSRDRAEDVFLRLRLDLRQLLEPVILRRFLELFDRRDLEVLVDRPGRCRPDTRHTKQRQEPGWHRGLELVVPLGSAGRDDLLDRLADRRTDLRDLLQSLLLDKLRERFTKITDRARRGVADHSRARVFRKPRQLGFGFRADDLMKLRISERIIHVGEHHVLPDLQAEFVAQAMKLF